MWIVDARDLDPDEELLHVIHDELDQICKIHVNAMCVVLCCVYVVRYAFVLCVTCFFCVCSMYLFLLGSTRSRRTQSLRLAGCPSVFLRLSQDVREQVGGLLE